MESLAALLDDCSGVLVCGLICRFQNPTSIVNVLKFQYRRQRGDNRGGLAGEWWDGQNFPWAEDLSKLSLPARGFSDSIVKSALTILGGSVTWDRRLLESGPAPTCLLSTPPWVHQVNVSARVVHLKYMPEKSLPRLS